MKLERDLGGLAWRRGPSSVEPVASERDPQESCVNPNLVRDPRHDDRLKQRAFHTSKDRMRGVPAAAMGGVVPPLNHHPITAPSVVGDRAVTHVLIPRDLTACYEPVHLGEGPAREGLTDPDQLLGVVRAQQGPARRHVEAMREAPLEPIGPVEVASPRLLAEETCEDTVPLWITVRREDGDTGWFVDRTCDVLSSPKRG